MNFKLVCLILLILSSFILIAQTKNALSASSVILKADDNDGHDEQWKSRPYYFKNTWGIRGSGKVEEGNIWFNSFPGDSGSYSVVIHTILEQDGSPHFSLKIGGDDAYNGRFPYLKGEKNCDKRGAKGSIELGEHFIKKGQKITIWGRSIYECGEKGAYALWHKITFTKKIEELCIKFSK